jgi:hypothetical protein
MDTHHNGTRLLLDDIDAELNKRISSRDKLLLRSMQYILQEIPETRSKIHTMQGEIATLEKSSLVVQAKKNPKTAFVFAILLFTLNSMVNWQGIRRPILQGVIYSTTGILIPLDALP